MDIRRLSNLMSGRGGADEDNGGSDNQMPEELYHDDNMGGIDTSQSIFSQSNSADETGDFEEGNAEFDSEGEEDFSDDSDSQSPSIYRTPSTTVNNYQSIESAQQGFDIIAGINDIPLKYRDENLLPELVAPSIQYNRFRGTADVIEWQIKARNLIRKHQMYCPEFEISERVVYGYTYINDLLLSRAVDGFERKMSNSNLSGVFEENASESAPASAPRKKGGFSSMFGGGNY